MNHSRAINARTQEIRDLLAKAEEKLLAGDWRPDGLYNVDSAIMRLDDYRLAQWRKQRREGVK